MGGRCQEQTADHCSKRIGTEVWKHEIIVYAREYLDLWVWEKESLERVGKKGKYLNEERPSTRQTRQISGNEDCRWSRHRQTTAFVRTGWKPITGPTHTAAAMNMDAPGTFSQSQTLKPTITKLMSQTLWRERKADLRQDNCRCFYCFITTGTSFNEIILTRNLTKVKLHS